MGPKNVAEITRWLYKQKFFLKENALSLLPGGQKKVAIGRGSAVLDNLVVRCQKVFISGRWHFWETIPPPPPIFLAGPLGGR